MKNGTVIFAGLVILLTGIIGCKKEEVKPSNDKTEQATSSLQIEGKWQFISINFLSNDVKWDTNVAYSPSNTFGYAPFMLKDMIGYQFLTNKVSSGEGAKFDFIDKSGHNADPNLDSWFWNYKGKNSFEIGQVNPEMPPYNFSVMNINNVEIVNQTLSFNADIYSRKVGGSMLDMLIVPVEIKLVQKEIDTNTVDLLLFGTPLTLP